MFKTPPAWLIGLLCGLLLVTRASAQDKTDHAAAVDKLFAQWARADSPGCALAVIRDGKVIHQRGYGMADLEHGIAITPETVFNIASVSKQFTVFLILLLVHAGLISLDDDVRRHVPEVPDFGKTITVRQLIHHTSGLREDWSMLTLAGWRSEDVITRDDVFNLLKRQKQLNFAPGEDYSYCNTGYHLLAQIVQNVSKKSLREFGQEKVFEPLGMKQTVFQDDHRQIIKGRAASYAPKKGGGYERVLYGAGRAGPGNLHTTVLDLARWDQNFYDPKVGGPKVLRDQLRKARLNNGKEIDYAGGLRHGKYRGLATVEHSGVIAGYRSVLLRFPEQKFSVVILANVSSFNPALMARRVADLHLRNQLDPPVKPASIKVPVEIASYAGEYRFASGIMLKFAVEKDTLFLQADVARARLTMLRANEFSEGESGARYTFAEMDKAQAMSVTVRGIGLDQVGTKIERPKLTAQKLAEFIGTFRSEELDTTYTVAIKNSSLFVRHRKGEVELHPLIIDEFSTPPGSLFSTIRFTRNAAGAITGFGVYTPRARDQRFTKVSIQPAP